MADLETNRVQRIPDGPRVHAALVAELAAGSDTGGTVDRALLAAGVPAGDLPRWVSPLVAAFTACTPGRLEPYPGAAEALAALAAAVPVGCLTDGNPVIQQAKLAATGLGPLLSEVLVTDTLGGRSARKPAPAGLLVLAARLGVPADRVLVIGDRPGKDVAVAASLAAWMAGLPSVRQPTGTAAASVARASRTPG